MTSIDTKCAPGRKYNDGSCFTVDELIKIAKSYNDTHRDKINIVNNKKILLKELTTKLKNKYDCNNQVCWLNTDIVKKLDNDMIKNFTFRPRGPNTKYEWLSSSEIDKVLEQYMIKYKDFKSFGALPYDFQELPDLEINTITFEQLVKNGIDRIGMVINLDEHYKSGSHWVALYIQFSKRKIYFFDSVGKKPRLRIKKFITQVMTFMYNSKYNTNLTTGEVARKHHLLKDFDIRYNKLQHQFENSECGVYSMNFIIRLLNGESFDTIVNNITKDTEMNSCRKVYFRN